MLFNRINHLLSHNGLSRWFVFLCFMKQIRKEILFRLCLFGSNLLFRVFLRFACDGVFAPGIPQRGRETDGGNAARKDTDGHRYGEAAQTGQTEEFRNHNNCDDSKEGGKGGFDGSAQRLVDAEIDAFAQIHGGVQLGVFTQTVVNYDGVVQRVT